MPVDWLVSSLVSSYLTTYGDLDAVNKILF